MNELTINSKLKTKRVNDSNKFELLVLFWYLWMKD